MKGVISLSLRPYHGSLYLTKTLDAYQAANKRYFKSPDDEITEATAARFVGGEGKDGMWTYIIYAPQAHNAAHELSHVLFHVFGRCDMDPRDSGGEAFCYMLGQLLLESEY